MAVTIGGSSAHYFPPHMVVSTLQLAITQKQMHLKPPEKKETALYEVPDTAVGNCKGEHVTEGTRDFR